MMLRMPAGMVGATRAPPASPTPRATISASMASVPISRSDRAARWSHRHHDPLAGREVALDVDPGLKVQQHGKNPLCVLAPLIAPVPPTSRTRGGTTL